MLKNMTEEFRSSKLSLSLYRLSLSFCKLRLSLYGFRLGLNFLARVFGFLGGGFKVFKVFSVFKVFRDFGICWGTKTPETFRLRALL